MRTQDHDRRATDAESPARGEPGPLTSCRALRALAGCLVRAAALIAHRRVHQRRTHVGRTVAFADGTRARVYRETFVDRPAPVRPVVLVLCFRLRRVRSEPAHAAFRLESELNTVLFAGFPGFVSKLWLRHDERGRYRGFYQWDGPAEAVAYARAMWWVLALVGEPGSVHYAVLPGFDRDEVLATPDVVGTVTEQADGWWRPIATPP